MKRHVFAGLLAVATPALAHAQTLPPEIGWNVSAGHSATGRKICTLFGGFGNHSGLAWVAAAHNRPQHFSLLFDDGGAPPQSHLIVSQLVVAAPGSQPLFMPGTVSFGQFRATLDRGSLDPLLHLFAAKRSMTVALEGDEPVSVNLEGSADAALDLRRCAALQTLHRRSRHHRVVAIARHRSTKRGRHAVRRIPEAIVAFEPPLPGPPPVAPAAPAAAMAPAILKPSVAAPIALPGPPPVAPAAPAAAIEPAVLKPAMAAPTALPGPPPVVPGAPAAAITSVALKPLVAAPTAAPTPAAPALPAPSPAIARAVLKPPVAAATALPDTTSAAAAQLALDDTALLAKAIEDQFVDILQDGMASYQNSGDKDLSLGARSTRATDLCILLGNDKEAIDWTGTISNISSTSQGGSVLAVKLADGITVGTTGLSSSDSQYPSGLEPASDVLKTISQMHVGEHVTFSGRFFPSGTDCVKETSPTLDQSMTSPNFLMKFTAVAAQP